MDALQISYEVSQDEYVSGIMLLVRDIKKPLWPLVLKWGIRSVGWVFLAAPIVTTVLYGPPDYGRETKLLNILLGLSVAGLLLASYRVATDPVSTAYNNYPHTGFPGKKFSAVFSSQNITVAKDHVQWIHEWPAYRKIEESERVFMFFDGSAMFVFAKRYFMPEQIAALQLLIKECWKPEAARKSCSEAFQQAENT